MRKKISDLIGEDPAFQVIGTARDGVDAIAKVKKLSPDVITLDLFMPKMDGLAVIRSLMKTTPVPILVVSAYSQENAFHTVLALKLGAVDVIAKPGGEISRDMEKVKRELWSKIKMAAGANPSAVKVSEENITPNRAKGLPDNGINGIKHPERGADIPNDVESVIMIGTSTGGPRSIPVLISQLPANLIPPIIIAQHMPNTLSSQYISHIADNSPLPLSVAHDGELLRNNHIYMGPGNKDIELRLFQGGNSRKITFKISGEKELLDQAPNIDRLFISGAEIFKEKAIGVVLTGMGTDGTEGARRIRENHGTVLAQDKKSSIVYGMPKSAAKYAHKSISLQEIPRVLTKIVQMK